MSTYWVPEDCVHVLPPSSEYEVGKLMPAKSSSLAMTRPVRVTTMSVSIDGFFEGPGGELDWHLIDEEIHTHFNEQLGAMSAFLEGRITYELMEGYWPTADVDPSASRPVAEFARIWRGMPKIVYSRTLETAGSNSTVVIWS